MSPDDGADRRRRPTAAAALSAVGVVLVALLAVSTVFGAAEARLEGTFDARLTITASDLDSTPPGTTVEREYKFKPLCNAGPCKDVRLSREGSTGAFVKTKLRRVAPNTYEGTEVQTNPVCADGSGATSREGDIHVEIVKKKAGLATKVKGTVKFAVEGCEETFQNARFVAEAR